MVRAVLRYILRAAEAAWALVVVSQKGLVTAKVIESNATFEGWALTISGGIIFVESLLQIIREARGKADEKRRADATKAVLGCLRLIAPRAGIDIASIGASVFFKQRDDKKLAREFRYRLTDTPQASEVAWVAGKGTVGRAWDQRRQLHANLKPISERWGPEITEAAFKGMKGETRAGFTYGEFRGIVGKYAEVLATPIVNSDGTYVGILSIDVPMTTTSTSLGTCLNNNEIKEFASNCAALLADVYRRR